MANDLSARSSLCLIQALGSTASEDASAALERARVAAERIPLVRVAIPIEGHERHNVEWLDVLDRGLFRVAHKSQRSREIEAGLGAPDSLYLHGGRAHPDYGTLVFILDGSGEPSSAECEASVSGLGGLLCVRTDAHACLVPVSHWQEAEQRRFYEQTTWRGAWREQAAAFLAGYYRHKGLSGYFGTGEDARPDLADPAGVFHNENITDWRAWTIEVRHRQDLDLNAALTEGRILGWAQHPDLRRLIDTRLKRSPNMKLAFYQRLCSTLAERELCADSEDVTAPTLESDRFCRETIGEW